MATWKTGSIPRSKFWMALAAVTLSGCVNTASSVTTQFYTVRGETSEQLDRELRRKGPLQGHALASAAIKFEPVSVFQTESEAGCVFKTAKFRVVANITLPRWQDRSRSRDRGLRSAWDGLSSYAKWHEQTHVKIAEEYAKLLGDALMELPMQKSCERLDRQAARTVQTISRAHDSAQLAFDAREQVRLRRLFADADERAAR